MQKALVKPAGKRRWRIGILLGAGVLVNYFDRIVVSVAAPELQHEFAMDAVALGFLFSAFNWSYSMLQIPAGLVLDRYGVNWSAASALSCGRCASAVTALASGFAGIFAARLVLGVAEAPGFPANAKATGYWFPRQERGLATALFDVGGEVLQRHRHAAGRTSSPSPSAGAAPSSASPA